MLTIRPQLPPDLAPIEAVNAAAFAEHGGTAAFDLFRRERSDILSLVALQGDILAGHVLFSPVEMQTPAGSVAGMGLGQLAVLPRYQQQGIGSQLAKTGIELLRKQQCAFIIVVGHAAYYPRFGFEPGRNHGVACQWPNVPDETFMVRFLDRNEEEQQQLTGVASFDGL
jgi:putative acetyltransferase